MTPGVKEISSRLHTRRREAERRRASGQHGLGLSDRVFEAENLRLVLSCVARVSVTPRKLGVASEGWASGQAVVSCAADKVSYYAIESGPSAECWLCLRVDLDA